MECARTDVKITGYYLIAQYVSHIDMAQTVPWTVVTVNTVKCVLWRQGLALMDAKKGGPGNIVIHSAVMEHTFRRVIVSNVRECVKTTHLVTSQLERVIMDVVIVGPENFVKNALMGFTTNNAAAFVVPVYWGTFATKSMDIVRVGAVPTIKNHCVKTVTLDFMESSVRKNVENVNLMQHATLYLVGVQMDV